MGAVEILFFVFIGIGLGVVSGLLPGIHVNTISAFILAMLPLFGMIEPLLIVVGIVSMAVVNSFLSFIPSILLGAPDSETVLSVLPGHRMLLNGEAIEAIKLTALGGLISLFFVVGTFFVSLLAIPQVSGLLTENMLYVLIIVTLIGIVLEQNPLYGAGIFLLSGVFGVLTLNNFGNGIVFPALSGLFGISGLLLSLNSRISIPAQREMKVSLSKLSLIKNSLLGSFAGAVVGFLPGIGAAQATFLVQQLNSKQGEKEFLVSNAAVSVGNTIFPLFVLYALGKTRSGVAIAVKELTGVLSLGNLEIILGIAVVVGIITYFLHIKLGVFLAKVLINSNPENYNRVSIGVIVFIGIMAFVLTGFAGLVVLGLGTLIGILPQISGVRRAQCMGYFVLPVILFYTKIF